MTVKGSGRERGTAGGKGECGEMKEDGMERRKDRGRREKLEEMRVGEMNDRESERRER